MDNNIWPTDAFADVHLLRPPDASGKRTLVASFKHTKPSPVEDDYDDFYKRRLDPLTLPNASGICGRHTLSLQLGARIGQRDGTHLVCAIDNAIIQPPNPMYGLPDVVIKVSRPGLYNDINKEAFFYEVMSDLQGSAIARCWGLYESYIMPSLGLYSDDDDDDKAIITGKTCILVLERLGVHLYGPYDFNRVNHNTNVTKVEVEIKKLCMALIKRDIEYGWGTMLRPKHILFAPLRPGEPQPDIDTSSEQCSSLYRLRLIDFTKACRTNTAPSGERVSANPCIFRALMEAGVAFKARADPVQAQDHSAKWMSKKANERELEGS